MNDKINKAKVLLAQSSKSIVNAYNTLSSGNEGRIRTISRRAAGFAISALNIFTEKDYGSHFLANLKNLFYDVSAPAEVRDAAMNLLERVSDNPISGKEAIEFAVKIVEFCKSKIDDFSNAK